jgi:putative CocE/NonD family hydrolase
MKNGLSTANYWRDVAYQVPERYAKVTVPSLAVTGWFDTCQSASPENYLALKKYGATSEARHPRLIIGPWIHWPVDQRKVGEIDYGPGAQIDWDGYVTRFFDYYLKGVANGMQNDPPVHVFVMGSNRWRAADDWPLPQTRWTKYFLDSRGRANSLKGDGLLTLAPPQAEFADTYTDDPEHPVRSSETAYVGIIGAADTTLSAIGDDVLIYQTPPLDSPVEVVGPIEATLYARTSARDTDWFVRLVDVQPNGKSLLLAEGSLRARSRDPENEGRYNSAKLSVIEPGKVYQYTIQFWRCTGNLFQAGHRIRVEICSSWYPYFLPNLNTGADNVALVPLSAAVIAMQTIMHGSKYPSCIVLPVLPPEIK